MAINLIKKLKIMIMIDNLDIKLDDLLIKDLKLQMEVIT